MHLPSDFDVQHWIDRLQSDPSFLQFEAALAADFERAVTALVDSDSVDPLVTARLVGELRGLREAQRLPSRLARLARETP